jgi:DNA replication and repair protein RecF
MYLRRIELEEFRCFHHLDLPLPSSGLRLVGSNASGKTSLLEAIYLLATTRSFRTATERQLIHRESGRDYGFPPYARLVGELVLDHLATTIEMTITVEPERNSARKRIRQDGLPRRAIDVVGTLKVVLFSPEDLELVLGAPSIRRRYLDISLSQIDQAYLRSLSRYVRLLEQRNSLLKQIAAEPARDRRAIEEQMAYWDEQLVIHGSYVLVARLRYVHRLAEALGGHFRELTVSDLPLSLVYQSTVPLPDPVRERVVLDSLPDAQARVAQRFQAALHSLRDDELRRGMTLIGPHRDDLVYALAGEELAAFGSRGMQRLAVVATKLAEIDAFRGATGELPVLLLDDVLSELDQEHQDRLLQTLSGVPAQRFVTATDRRLLEHPALAGLPMSELSDGQVCLLVEP